MPRWWGGDGYGERTLGAVDCEAVSTGLLAQPVAALTSLAFVGAAGWLAARLPASGRERWAAGGYAVLLGLVGAGSFVYHGPQPTGAEVLHDIPVALVLLTGAAVPIARWARGRPPLAPGGSRFARAAAATLTAGLAAYLLGRTGSPLCRPDSVLQPHGLWHVLTAVASASWGRALWDADPTPPA